jgi:hypothetical protein
MITGNNNQLGGSTNQFGSVVGMRTVTGGMVNTSSGQQPGIFLNGDTQGGVGVSNNMNNTSTNTMDNTNFMGNV